MQSAEQNMLLNHGSGLEQDVLHMFVLIMRIRIMSLKKHYSVIDWLVHESKQTDYL